jgi:squalene synthase HpnD
MTSGHTMPDGGVSGGGTGTNASAFGNTQDSSATAPPHERPTSRTVHAIDTPVTATEIAAAYRYCEQLTRTQARNFSYGIRLLPPTKRAALSAVYAFARRVDDIGDGQQPADERLAGLEQARADLHVVIDAVAAGQSVAGTDLVLVALADAAGKLPIPLDAFDELIEGCEDDVRGTRYATADELVDYCRKVAGSIGRLSLGVFGTGNTPVEVAAPLANALGIALQLTNILRDVREDAGNGRVYLPAQDLDQFGCTLGFDEAGRSTDAPEKIAALLRFEAERAREWYATGLRLIPLLDRGSAASCAAMAGIYRRVLERIAADPAYAIEHRVSLSLWAKLGVAFSSMTKARR